MTTHPFFNLHNQQKTRENIIIHGHKEMAFSFKTDNFANTGWSSGISAGTYLRQSYKPILFFIMKHLLITVTLMLSCITSVARQPMTAAHAS
ncbi:MAG: hypothetical protein K2G86_02610, partial [Prevotella sp.]|nr:hypothetical protein [Prevotella sp.]